MWRWVHRRTLESRLITERQQTESAKHFAPSLHEYRPASTTYTSCRLCTPAVPPLSPVTSAAALPVPPLMWRRSARPSLRPRPRPCRRQCHAAAVAVCPSLLSSTTSGRCTTPTRYLLDHSWLRPAPHSLISHFHPDNHPHSIPCPVPSPPLPSSTSVTPMPAPDRLASLQYIYIQPAVPAELHTVIHSFLLAQRWAVASTPCGHCLYVVSAGSSEEALLAVHQSIGRLQDVVLVSSALFASPTSPSTPLPSPPPVSALVAYLSLLSSARLCSTSLPSALRALCFHLASTLGGYTSTVFDLSITHLLTLSSVSDKYSAAQRSLTRPSCLTPTWLLQCFLTGRLQDVHPHLFPLLAGLRISVTGLELEERDRVRALIKTEGGQYDPNLMKDCTHLIAQASGSKKYEAAVNWGLHVVTGQWLVRSVEERRLMPEADFPVPIDGASADSVPPPRPPPPPVDVDEEVHPEVVVELSRRETARQLLRAEEEKREAEEKRRKEEDEEEKSSEPSTNGWRQKAKKPIKTGEDRRPSPAPQPKRHSPPVSVQSNPPAQSIPAPPPSHSPPPIPLARPPSPPSSTSPSSSPPSTAESIAPLYDPANDSFLESVQALLVFPPSSPLYPRLVALLRVGGATRLSSYRPSLTHLIAPSLAALEAALKADRFAVGFTSLDAVSVPVVSADWLEKCVEKRDCLSVDGFRLEDADPLPRPAAPQRLSSVARQRTMTDFSAFNASITKPKSSSSAAPPPLTARERRRRARSAAVGVFAGRLFAFHGLTFDDEQRLLAALRTNGGDLKGDDDDAADVDFLITPTWAPGLTAPYPKAALVTPKYVNDCLGHQALLSPTLTFTHQPLPAPVPSIPGFAPLVVTVTGFNEDKEERWLLAQCLGALGAERTEGLNARNSHCICKEGMTEGRKWDYAFGGRWKGKMVRLGWVVECARQGRLLDEAPWLWTKEDGNSEREMDVAGTEEQTEEPEQSADELETSPYRCCRWWSGDGAEGAGDGAVHAASSDGHRRCRAYAGGAGRQH